MAGRVGRRASDLRQQAGVDIGNTIIADGSGLRGIT